MKRSAKAYPGLTHRLGARGELVFFRAVEAPKVDLVKRWRSRPR